MDSGMPRNRIEYVAWVALVIMAGLVSRSSWAKFLPELMRDYAGDTLWALMVFLILGFLFPRTRTVALAAVALVISFSVEFSQIYQAEWINQIRATRIGGLVLGRGWVPTDLVCYTVGVAIGAAGEIVRSRGTESCRVTSDQ